MNFSAKVHSRFGNDIRTPHFVVARGKVLPEATELLAKVKAHPDFLKLEEGPQATYVVHVWRKRLWRKPQRLRNREVRFKIVEGRPELLRESQISQS